MLAPEYLHLPNIRLPLTVGSGEKERVPFVSGLNWGQRPGRDPNQAYLAIPIYIQKSNFFPALGVPFQIITDDDECWVCARRQANGKAIHTIKDNTLLGKYFRKRLNLESGDMVTLYSLLKYGRTSVEIFKKSETVFFLDFSIYSK